MTRVTGRGLSLDPRRWSIGVISYNAAEPSDPRSWPLAAGRRVHVLVVANGMLYAGGTFPQKVAL